MFGRQTTGQLYSTKYLYDLGYRCLKRLFKAFSATSVTTSLKLSAALERRGTVSHSLSLQIAITLLACPRQVIAGDVANAVAK